MNPMCFTPEINPFESAQIAVSVNQENAIPTTMAAMTRASGVTAKFWNPGRTINVSFLNGSQAQHDFVINSAQEWIKTGINIKFNWTDNGEVRVRFGGGGSWSYIGSDCLGIRDRNSPTIEFGWQEKATVIHEFGHMLGLLHGHTAKNFPYHFNEAVVIKELSGPPNNWSVDMIRENVLKKTTAIVTETPWENKNIMNYYFPKEWIEEKVAIEPGEMPGRSEIDLLLSKYGTVVVPPVVVPPVVVPPVVVPPVVTMTKIREGEVVTGVAGINTYKFVLDKTGVFIPKTSNRSVIAVNGHRFQLNYLAKGTHDVVVNSKSKFTLKIIRMV